MVIKTNNVPRPLLSGYDLTEQERKDLSYIADPNDIDKWMEEFDRFFRYKGAIYDTIEFVRIERRSELSNSFCHPVDDDSPLLKWQGIQTDSYFSAIVIRYTDDLEYVVVGLALS